MSMSAPNELGTSTTTLPFDYKEAIKGRVDPMPLQPGDTVVVP